MIVNLTNDDLETVVDHGSVIAITGTSVDNPTLRVTFAGDHRSMGGLLALLEDDLAPSVAIEGWQILAGEVERSWDDYPEDRNGACLEAHTAMHNIDQDKPGWVGVPTPGYDGDHDLGLVYSVSETEEEIES